MPCQNGQKTKYQIMVMQKNVYTEGMLGNPATSAYGERKMLVAEVRVPRQMIGRELSISNMEDMHGVTPVTRIRGTTLYLALYCRYPPKALSIRITSFWKDWAREC